MKIRTVAVAVTLVIASCGGGTADSDTTTTAANAADSTTTEAPAGAATTATTTTTTTTTEAPATTMPPTTSPPSPEEGVAWFAISEVIFGDAGRIVIENVGTATGAIEGYWLCQRPDYFEIPTTELAPGERLAVFVGGAAVDEAGFVATMFAGLAVGTFEPADGEVGLYSNSSFSSAAAIVDYVEWGNTGHPRSSVAVEAGLWLEGDFLDVPADALGITSASATTKSAADWSIEVGG